MKLTPPQVSQFQKTVRGYFAAHRRTMPWREDLDPYCIVVSEIMLQQTQVDRVKPKFQEFMRQFPTLGILAAVPQSDVLRAWAGLGYNRRAKFLHQTAKIVMSKYDGQFPAALPALLGLPGIGPGTAAAILVYAFNKPQVFIETNIRTVYIHHFFGSQPSVSDSEIGGLLEQTLDKKSPREWYWALMDYGTHLKRTAGNNIARSRHYAKQPAFAGSRRQVRGKIIKLLTRQPHFLIELEAIVADARTLEIIDELQAEGLVSRRYDTVQLSE